MLIVLAHRSLTVHVVQELANWDPRRNPNVRPLPDSHDAFPLDRISKGLSATRDTPVMVPMLQSFEAAGSAAGGEGQLDALITIAGVSPEVCFTCLFASSGMRHKHANVV